jgi:enamine deaminase RidA (YjgF/YER057c/UK114 family)
MRADGNYASDPQQQFTDLFDNIATVLDAARLTFADVIEMTSYHTDMASLPVFQNVKDQYLSEPWPAWTAVGVTSLALPEATAEVRLVCRDPSTD